MASDDVVTLLRAKDEIRDVLYRYCRAADRCDVDLLASVYHPDATEDHGGFVGPASEFRAEVIPRLRGRWVATQHLMGNILIDIDGDVAHTESYFVAYHQPPRDDRGRVPMWVLGARYVDRFERRDGRWLIAHRVMVKDWEDTRPIVDLGERPFQPQHRDRTDVSYHRPVAALDGRP